MDEPSTNTASTPPAQAPRALDGIRVLDFSWVRAGPWATRWLGALGAEVIKIEWPENERGRGGTLSTPQDVPVNLNTSGNFNDTNANKLSVSLNVRSELGMDIIKRLLAISDIVIENFSSRVLTKWGLSYDAMREIKPDIVYVSMSGYGHTGRNHNYTTFGPVAQAVSGLTQLSGLPDQPPAGWGWSYMDDTGGMYGAMCALTGLYHRNMTGQGQHIDQSQMISGVPLNGPSLLDFTVNGRPSQRPGFPPGNRTHWPGTPLFNSYRGPTVAPHNAYRTAPGEFNDWCVIVARSDEQWQALIGVMGAPSWAQDARYSTVQGRLEHQDALDEGIERWTSTLDKYSVTEQCQQAGVQAMPVQSAEDRVMNDPQLRHRDMYVPLEHGALGSRALQNAPFKMSQTASTNRTAGPRIGEHTREVLERLLGMSREEIVAGYDDGTFWPTERERFDYHEEMLK
ncbi:MAG: crotonobetainyl-CoA:carnitine CoA-transferase CaiB-like acyl-CoA transferase [Gammaproteobacteria bacterium]|jgi:crotonobetainyl-CoA:carnitine CoA-transferase CaiB-like acyl-CoA transferase